MGELRRVTITCPSRLQGLEPDWWTLWHRVTAAPPFLSPAWLLPWWRHLGHGQLRTWCWWDGAELVGIAPLLLYQADPSAPRQLIFLGTSLTDQLDVLFLAERSEELYAALSAALRDDANWDALAWEELSGGSPTLTWAAEHGANSEVCSQLPVVPLAAPPDEFLATRGHGLARNVRRYARQLAEKGQVQWETATPASAENALAALIQLHSSRWQERGEAGVLQDVRVQQFHRDVCQSMSGQGLLRLHTLAVDHEPVASIYAFARGQVRYGYLCGFAAGWAEYSPGTVAIGLALTTAIDERASCWNFLRGVEEYKLRWGAVPNPHYRLSLAKQQFLRT